MEVSRYEPYFQIGPCEFSQVHESISDKRIDASATHLKTRDSVA